MPPRALPFLAASLLAAGCWELLPASRDPIRDAEHREGELCPKGTPKYPAGLFSPQAVTSVGPLSFVRSDRGSQDSHLIGATIGFLPPANTSSEELERLLNCHAVRSELGRAGEPVVPNDPFSLPGHVVHIAVDFDKGVTRVKVDAQDVAGAQELLRRATAFAATPAQ
jgi:hypothetical protein